MKVWRMERAEANIDAELWDCVGVGAREYAEAVWAEIAMARARIEGALSTPARKRAERSFGRLLLELEEETYQNGSARARREYDAERNAAAWSRGADYMTEQRTRDRIRMIYGS
jgi:hypothetical protein